MATLFLPHGELVAQAWLRGIDGVPTNGVGTTLPRDNSTWEASGFVQIEGVVGGSPNVDLPISNPVFSIKCWANKAKSNKPPWGRANQLAERIRMATFGTVDAPVPSARIVALAPSFQNARVQSVRLLSEPRRMLSDEARFALYQFDMQMTYVPTELPATIGPPPITPPSGLENFVYHQTIPSATWVISHNLGREVQVTIWDDTGEVVYPEIDNPDLNTTVVIFSTSATGTAIIG